MDGEDCETCGVRINCTDDREPCDDCRKCKKPCKYCSDCKQCPTCRYCRRCGKCQHGRRPRVKYPLIIEEMEKEVRDWENIIRTIPGKLESTDHWDLDYTDDPDDPDGLDDLDYRIDPDEGPTKNEFFQQMLEGFESKRIFVCCDGTWQNASGTISPMTNVAKLARAVDRIGRDEYMIPSLGHPPLRYPYHGRQGFVRQLVYYSPGIGTQSSLRSDRHFSAATGADEIILVGFSRGAFTVRCLAHFINTVGLLRRKGLPFLHTVFNTWKEWGEAGNPKKKQKWRTILDREIKALQDLLYDKVRIKILAEWDPVSAIGLPLGFWKEKFSFVNEKVPANVDHALVALALDEKRPMFKPRQCHHREQNGNTDVQQCVFVGCHSDVGGGVPDVGLSTISLLWMVSKIEEVSDAKFDNTTLLQFMVSNQPPRTWFGSDRDAQAGGLGGIGELDNDHRQGVQRRWPWRKPRIQLKNFATTKGVIHESRTKGWSILHMVTLGQWHGKRDEILNYKNDDLPLKVHFTARLLKPRLNCRFFRHYEPLERRWRKLKDPITFVLEDDVNARERKLLRRWRDRVDEFRPGWTQAPLDDGDVNWTDLARGMGWDLPEGDVPGNALIKLIAENGYLEDTA